MRTLAFDGRMGASGDMVLGALVAAGADTAVLDAVTAVLDVRYRVTETTKNGIAATSVDVLLDDGGGGDGDHHDESGEHHHDDHSHHHHHDDHSHHHHHHDHSHHHHGDGTHAEGHGPHRTLPEVLELVDGMALPADVADTARAVFERLARAEAAVHGSDVDETAFHEVGADDAIADVVGACLLLDDLGVERVVTTPLSTGDGEVSMAHGTYPIPAPAVVELAAEASWSLRGGPVDAELLTPTAAALLAELAEGVDSLPPLGVVASGYGAGGYDFPERPNVLRALVGDGDGRLVRDDITVLETNLDDATPEVLGSLHESLAAVGARDVSVLPASMKKSRPGHLVKVVTKPEDAERVAARLAAETGTLGVREHGAGHRWVAHRRFETVTVDAGGDDYEVTVKIASTADGDVYDVSAEHDDAAAAARDSGVPLRDVARRAESAARATLDGDEA